MNRHIKIIAVSALSIGVFYNMLHTQAGLQRFMPFVARIVHNSPSFLEYATGSWIKKLAIPYGAKCNYPVLVKKDTGEIAYAQQSTIPTGAQPKRDAQGKVILDPTDKDLVKSGDSPSIIFDDAFVKKMQYNRALLAATLLHETKHLDEEHDKKIETLRLQGEHAMENQYGMVLRSGTPITARQFNAIASPGLEVLTEHEADSAFKAHPDLCRAEAGFFAPTRAEAMERDLDKFRKTQRVWKEIRDEKTGATKLVSEQQLVGPPDKKAAELYQKACAQQDRDSYEKLEQLYRLSHPLDTRRHQYCREWAEDAEKNQVKQHPSLQDAWVDYCTRHIEKEKKK